MGGCVVRGDDEKSVELQGRVKRLFRGPGCRHIGGTGCLCHRDGDMGINSLYINTVWDNGTPAVLRPREQNRGNGVELVDG